MQILNIPDAQFGSPLLLGVQTNPDLVNETAHWKAKTWAPKNAKSYRFSRFVHTNYDGYPTDKPTGYARIEVEYFTTTKEGEFNV